MSFYAELAQVAQDLLAEYGQETTLTKVTAGVYNPATGTAAETRTPRTVTAAAFDYETKYIDGTLILSGDKQVFMSVVGNEEPKPGDLLAWMGRDWRVITFKNLAPAGISVLYELQVRGA